MTQPLVIPCHGCLRPLTSGGCTNRACTYGPGTGYTLPPPPKITDMPDPFPELCPTCLQPRPKPTT